MNISIPSGVFKNLAETLAEQYPQGLSSDQFEAMGSVMQQAIEKNLEEHGYPSGLMERLNDPDFVDNADVWDAHVSYMADHPNETPPDFDQLDAAIQKMAHNPDAEVAYLDSLVSNMAQQSTGNQNGADFAGIKDQMGTGLLQNLSAQMQTVNDQVLFKLEEQGQLAPHEIVHTVQSTNLDLTVLQHQLEQQPSQSMLNQIHSILDKYEDSSMGGIENLRGDPAAVIEGEADVTTVEENVVDADPETEIFDAYGDEDGTTVEDDPNQDASI